MKNLTKIKEFLNSNYNFRYNEVTGKVELKKINSSLFTPMSERDISSLLIDLLHEEMKLSIQDLRIILQSNFVVSINPIRDYFETLPQLTGKENIRQLMTTINTHDNIFFEWAFTKWLVAWVACMFDENAINQQCVILSGNQGIGKSTWVENLIPKKLKPYYYEGNIKLGNRDTLVLLSDKCLINLDELANMTYSNVTELKELVTKSNISLRRAYGHFFENFIRRASFIGSVNGTEFLYDLTGNRRFLSFEAYNFLNFGNHNVDMNLVLAEAYNLYKSGFQFWFDTDDQKRVEKNNEQFVVKSAEEIKLLEIFSKSPNVTEKTKNLIDTYEDKLQKLSDDDFNNSNSRNTLEALRRDIKKIEEKSNEFLNPSHLRTLEIFEKISYKNPKQGDLIRMGKILVRNGFKNKRTNQGTLYEVYKIEKIDD